MARKPRLHYIGAVYHVMVRGNGGQNIFADDDDRCRFYLFLQEGVEKLDHQIHAFCRHSREGWNPCSGEDGFPIKVLGHDKYGSCKYYYGTLHNWKMDENNTVGFNMAAGRL